MKPRIYLDHNATTALRPQARAAMIAAMDCIGNPSSVHAEGRTAKNIVERARAQVAAAVGASGADVVFTSCATEAAALALAARGLLGSEIEHDAVLGWIDPSLPVDAQGQVTITDPATATLQLANSETGVIQTLPQGIAVSDVTQAIGRIPFAYSWSGVGMIFLSAHKLGGPKGVGALVFAQGTELAAQIKGGGQEMGRRSGTENVAGIAGFGAAAEAAAQELVDGVWDRVAKLRNILEEALAVTSKDTIFVGNGAKRLPNTACFITPGWKGETQVMAMDLAGYAISAGSACSSGKVKASRVLRAMGYGDDLAASAVRISLGPDTTKDEVLRFAQDWGDKLKRHRTRAA